MIIAVSPNMKQYTIFTDIAYTHSYFVICLKCHVRENSVNEVVVRFLSPCSNYELGQWRRASVQ